MEENAEIINEKGTEKNKKEKNNAKRKTLTINGISIWRILAYFMI